MSRRSKRLTENITIHFGVDHSLGGFADITDKRYAASDDDKQGEGVRYLGEIGIGTNPHLRRHVVNGLLVEKIGGMNTHLP